MAFAEYGGYDGVGLAELVRAGQVSPSELVEEAIVRIEAANPALNAVVNRMYDFARKATAAGLPDGPFKGVPFLLKDLLAMVAGVPTSCGTRLLRSTPALRDNEIVRRFKAAGLVILGKTNTPEFGMVPYTEPEAFGPTRNPWDTTRTPGGSSGGSAAAVASRMVPMAAGADGGGSIRIPASCCGVFGLKPTRGRTPTGPDIGEIWRGFVVEHALTRSVRDSAALLDAISGADTGAPYLAPPQARSFLSEVTAEPGRLQVAFTAQPFLGNHVHPDCVTALEDTVRLLKDLGHDVFEAAPTIDAETFSLAFMTIVAAEVRADMEWAAGLAGRAPAAGDFEDTTYALGLLGRAMGASEYSNAARVLQAAAREVGRFFETCDVLLTPTLADPPVPIGSLQPSGRDRTLVKVVGRLNAGWLLQASGVIRQLAAQAFGFIPYTPVFNVTGQPAMSVPLHWNAAGLPIGVHVVGRFGDEATLFRLAGQLERARPWSGRWPPVRGVPESTEHLL
jgi:amidase